MQPLLGTFVEIGVVSSDTDKSHEDAIHIAISQAFNVIALIQKLLSFHDPESDLSKLNGAKCEWISLHPQSMRVLRLARTFTQASEHFFNCTVGGALVHEAILPDHFGQVVLARGNAADIEFSKNSVRLRRSVLITLDGIAKGYAVDLAVQTLQEHQITAGWINAGGDLRVFGCVTLPIQRRELDDSLQFLSEVSHCAIATSTVDVVKAARFPGKVVSGNHYTPQPGVWTTTAPYAWKADALTKVASLAPIAKKRALIAKLGGQLICSKELNAA